MSMTERLDAMTQPTITLNERDGLWYPATSWDIETLIAIGLLPPFLTSRLDLVLEAVSNAGYWLETVPEKL